MRMRWNSARWNEAASRAALARSWADTAPTQVLLAEDEDDMRSLLAGWLRRAGLEVVEVANGHELAQQLTASLLGAPDAVAFDLVISDIRMPGPSGLDALAQLRRGDGAIPVILITAFGDQAVKREANRLGATMLSKPFNARTLLAALEHFGLLDPRIGG